jgi:CBS domain-containing protein
VTLVVEEAMIKDVFTIEVDASILSAIDIMAEKNLSSLLVTNGGALVGIITEKDIIKRVYKTKLDSSSTKVLEIMSNQLVTVVPETTVSEANKIMIENKIKKLPVVDSKDRRLVGLLSLSDLAKIQPKILEREIALEKMKNSNQRINMLCLEESQQLEFKSTLRWDLQKKCVNPLLEKANLKSICAFLNSDGGELVIGISDDHEVIGLDHDYKTCKNQNRDGFENKLTSLIQTMIGVTFTKNVKPSFFILDGKEICKIKIDPGGEPAFLHENGQEQFYVRTGNSSRPFSLSETVKYVKTRWPA